VAREGRSVQVEGQVILSLFYRREKQIDRAMPIMIALAARFPSNYLYRMELTRQLLEAGRAQDALRELAVLEEGARPGGRYANVSQERMLTLRADVLTAARDWDRALEALARLEALSGGTQATRAKAWLKRGYVYDLKGDRAQALAAYRQAIRLAPESEWAEQSRRYLNKPFKV
jgi:tetratricopeptide (TPR) repeat protein